MSLKDLDLVKLSKLTSEYVDELKCLECCKFFIAPATASCGHTLCHTCWRGRRTCPLCATPLDRKSLKLNLPFQTLTSHIQTLGEAFEKLFNIELDEFSLDTPGDVESEKDPTKNVKEWLISSQNHFSAPVQNSETFSQESQQTPMPVVISASNVIIHTDEKKADSPPKAKNVVHISAPQDDWDKIEPMPEVETDSRNNQLIAGPMDIQPFFIEDNEYSTDNPRRSSRKRDVKCDNSNAKQCDQSSNKHTSVSDIQRDRESRNSRDSCDNDKKSQKGKQTWSNVKRMRKEFSKLNKKNRNKLNVSIEMVKKTQNVKPISSTPVVSQQIENIDDNTPNNADKENDMLIIQSDDSKNRNQDVKTSTLSIKHNTNQNSDSIKLGVESNSNSNVVLKDYNTEKISDNNNDTIMRDVLSSNKHESISKGQPDSRIEQKLQFIKKGALCPKNVEVTCNNTPDTNSQEMDTENCDDIEISIKIGNTITNIVIKKKNNVQVKINTDREVQTSLGPDKIPQNEIPTSDKNGHDTDINNAKTGYSDAQINISRTTKTQVVHLKGDKSLSEKKNTASADTGTAQFEITESVEKELSNVMEYKTTQVKDTSKNINKPLLSSVGKPQQDIEENLEELNDIDIFSGSIKEGNVQLLKEHAPSEILISTVNNKLKTQRNVEKRNRENDDDPLPKTKKVRMTPKSNVSSSNIAPPDSEPINYDVIMGQVFASIDADMEDIRNSQTTQNIKSITDDQRKDRKLNNEDIPEPQKTQIITRNDRSKNQKSKTNIEETFRGRHSENVFSMMEKDEDNTETANNDIPQQVEELLTPGLCQNLDSSQESCNGPQKTNKSNKMSQDYDDSDRSVVEETPQKDISFPKGKRSTTSNQSQIALNETKKIPSKDSARSMRSVINLTDTVTESNRSSKDVTVVEPAAKKITLETPLTISKFADHIIYKSTPVARKSLNFDQENNDDDPEQTLCPTSEVIAKTTQEREFMSKAFEKTPTTPSLKPNRTLSTRNIMTKTNRKCCLAASRLTSDEIAKVKIVCAQRKWSYNEKYTKDITHLVVSVDEENKSQRSVKYMSALADSKWIVSFEWIEKCLKTMDYVDEEYFEALDSFGEPGPKRSRIAKRKLFQGIKFFCMPPFSVLDVVTLKNMLTAAGGRVVKEIKDVCVSNDDPQPALLLAEPEHTQEDRFIYLAMEKSIVPVNFEWVLNCLGSYSLGSIQELLLCPSSLLPAATAKWPEVLLAQDYD